MAMWAAATVFAAGIAGPTRGGENSGAPADFAAYQQRRLGEIGAKYRAVMRANADVPGIMEFADRINLIDEVTDLLVARFDAVREASLDALLGGAGSGPPDDQPPGAAADARQILSEYVADFRQPLPRPVVADDDVRILRQYYAAKASLASEFIAQRASIALATDRTAAGSLGELCLVMPLLHVSDDRWSGEQIRRLPDWLRTGGGLRRAESFALHFGRLRTAHSFALARREIEKPDAGELSYADYLSRAADRAADESNFAVSVQCLRELISIAAERDDTPAVIDARTRLSRALETVGHFQAAADEMKDVMDASPDADLWRQAAVRFCVLTCRAKAHDAAAEAAGRLMTDERAHPIRAHLLYVRWISLRSADKPLKAQAARTEFLSRYGESILAADMHFVHAVDLLQKGRIEEATELLRRVRTRYPRSPLADKAEGILNSLEGDDDT